MMRKKLILTLSICSIISFNSYAFNESPTTDKVQTHKQIKSLLLICKIFTS